MKLWEGRPKDYRRMDEKMQLGKSVVGKVEGEVIEIDGWVGGRNRRRNCRSGKGSGLGYYNIVARKT